MARSSASHAKAGCVLEAAACTSHEGLAPKDRGLSTMQCSFIGYAPTITSAARRARAASSRTASPPERKRAQWRLSARHAKGGCVLEVAASKSHHDLAPKERGLSPMPHPFYRVRTDHRQRSTARTRSKRACASSRERASAVAHSRARHAMAFCVWEASAGTSQRGLAPKETGNSLVQWPCIMHGAKTTRAGRCAHA